MKKLIDIINDMFFIICLIVLCFVRLFETVFIRDKENNSPDELYPKGGERISKTTYPDFPASDENEWYQYINNQRLN